MPFKRGDIVEYHAVNPQYNSLNGHTGMIVDLFENSVGVTEYTISWLTNIAAELRIEVPNHRVDTGWREAVLRYVTHVDVPV